LLGIMKEIAPRIARVALIMQQDQGHSKNAPCHEGDGVGAIFAEVLAGFGD
jgi:hypothetical protein